MAHLLNATSSPPQNLAELAFVQQISLLFRSSLVGLVTAAVGTLAIRWLLDGAVATTYLNLWMGFFVLVVTGRLLLWRSQRQQTMDAHSARNWARYFCVGAALQGCVWGVCGTFLAPIEQPALLYALVGILSVVPALALPTLGGYLPAYVSFALPAMLPGSLRLLTLDGSTHFSLGVSSLAYLIIVVSMARRADQETTAGIRQRLEIERLARESLAARMIAERASMELRQEILVREAAQVELKSAKDSAERANAAKSQFLANMSHEIRTPLNGVIGMTELLRKTELSAQQRRYVAIAHRSGEALLEVINDILDFSKIEAGHMELESVPLDPAALLQDLVEELLPQAASKGISLQTNLGDAVPVVLGDPVRLKQILRNLIGNAIKFTHQGGVNVRLEVEADSEFAPEPLHAILVFSVADTGVGISEAAQTTLFNAFVQADGSTTRQFGGTGLGLAIVKELVERMEGTVAVTSVLGYGSTFRVQVSLPRLDRRPNTSVSSGLSASL